MKPANHPGAGLPAPAGGGADASAGAEQALLEQLRQRARTPLIIERPEGVLTASTLMRSLVTLLWWGVWGHFMLPLFTLLLWMSGFRRFSEELLGRDGLDALISRLPLYLAVVGLLCGGLIGWALLNWWRFADSDRRRSSRSIAPETFALSSGIAQHELARWQAARRLVVLHDAEGRPIGLQAERALQPPA